MDTVIIALSCHEVLLMMMMMMNVDVFQVDIELDSFCMHDTGDDDNNNDDDDDDESSYSVLI